MADRRYPTLPDSPREGWPIGRAAFLGTIVAGAVAVFAGAREDRRPPTAATAISGADGAGLAAAASAGPKKKSKGWRIYTVNTPMPKFDPATFALTIGGGVENPVTLAWDDVLALETVEQTSDFHCVTGWSVYAARWRGFRPQTVVDLVKPGPEAKFVTFVSAEDPYVDQLTVDQFLLPDTMLAHTLDEEPLPKKHGAPLRLIVPQMYGYKSVKWVREIRFEAEPQRGFWEERGYDADAWVGRSNGISA